MGVVAILGILAVVAIGAYSRQVRNAHKSEVLADLSNLTLRQKSFLSVSGHYASSTNCEGPNCTFPTGPTITARKGEVSWASADPDYDAGAYTADSLASGGGEFFRGGEDVHGFDALRFMPEGAKSHCGYATISGYGTDAADDAEADEPPTGQPLAGEIFPPGSDAYYARDWFYSYALCDFDYDGVYWAFTTAHYTSDISSVTDGTGTYRENE